jgi:predicted cupin superfamily sugar epimerase
MGTTMAPGFTREGFELGDARALAAAYPSRGDLIGRLARAGAAILVTRGSP